VRNVNRPQKILPWILNRLENYETRNGQNLLKKNGLLLKPKLPRIATVVEGAPRCFQIDANSVFSLSWDLSLVTALY